MLCSECGKEKSSDQYNLDGSSPTVCFKCRVSSVSIGFGGHREFFHNDTIKAYQERTVREGRANGLDPVPVRTAAGTGTTSAGLERLKQHHLTKDKKNAK